MIWKYYLSLLFKNTHDVAWNAPIKESKVLLPFLNQLATQQSNAEQINIVWRTIQNLRATQRWLINRWPRLSCASRRKVTNTKLFPSYIGRLCFMTSRVIHLKMCFTCAFIFMYDILVFCTRTPLETEAKATQKLASLPALYQQKRQWLGREKLEKCTELN